jgi:hypothetical protein
MVKGKEDINVVFLSPNNSHDCKPSPVTFRLPVVDVLILQTPSHGHWLILIVFSLKYPKI